MKKRSYKSSEPKEVKPVKNVPISFRENDVAAEGANGWNLLEMGIEGFGQDPANYEENLAKKPADNRTFEDIIDLMVELGDAADEKGEKSLANFADFLLVKYAETKEDDPTILFNQLLVKIANADLPDTNDILKKLTKIFSRTVLLEYSQHNDLKKAKNSAYKKILTRANQYISE
tara:strand:+ start:1832 stop:2356 length:525 start_codon:yes stop_codon:yes gene_type:complete